MRKFANIILLKRLSIKNYRLGAIFSTVSLGENIEYLGD